MKQTEMRKQRWMASGLIALVLAGCAGTAGSTDQASSEPASAASADKTAQASSDFVPTATAGKPLPMWVANDAIPSKQQSRQVYKLDPAAVKANAVKVANDLKTVPDAWKNAPILYYVVDPLSDIKRVPDLYPEDGKPAGTLQIVASKGEFEPASFLVYARKNADKFSFTVSDLKNAKNGDVIPASALDAKLVKVWYQCGAGWFGYMADPLRRTLTPEMLVNDEKMIFVDPNTQDNYARYTAPDGTFSYEWISADFQVSSYLFSNLVRIGMIHDADTLQPTVLNKDEFKQFMVTAQIPKTARGGIYEGTITMTVDGKIAGTMPVQIGVLNFELPNAATNYDINKEFYLSMYGTGGAQDNERILKNLVDHNVTHIGGIPDLNSMNEKKVRKEIALLEKYGAATRPLFFNGPGCGFTFPGGEPQNDEQKASMAKSQEHFNKVAEFTEKMLGHRDVYCYGMDEGGYWAVKGERAAWKGIHNSGMKVMVSTHNDKRMLYPLDFMILPRMPSKDRSEVVRLFHASHPNGLCGWYADPHSGPENPDYFRRIHGLMSYKADYDFAANYCWYRNDWNDMAIAYESNYRGIIIVYAINDRIIDTLAWEGIREGIDDIRYATKVKQLALEAEKSKDGNVIHLGRKALGYIAYWDTRGNPDTFRMECVNYIIELEKALKKVK